MAVFMSVILRIKRILFTVFVLPVNSRLETYVLLFWFIVGGGISFVEVFGTALFCDNAQTVETLLF